MLFEEKFGYRTCQNGSLLIMGLMNAKLRSAELSHSSPVTLWISARLWVRRGPQHLGHTKAWGIFFRLASCFSKQMMKALVRKMGRTNTGIVAENGNFHSTAEKEKDKNNLLLVVYFILVIGFYTQLFFQKSQKMLGLRSLFYKCREQVTDLPEIRLTARFTATNECWY